ncbi:MAG: thiamine biosynthesis lipoprotein [Stygiobacter sp.]|nr:MAG: thiamine biosynthesis lipoprotein [Stygiobacter sp.]KAF0216960.1 MAG: thiamine biosynthesis [Ignavibacteria bacterium]
MQNLTQIKNAYHFTHVAMATLFDLIIIHENQDYAQQAAWEAIKEIDRLENELSRFKPNSDISRINNLKIGERIILGADSFNCISRGIDLHKSTYGAFNIACGALLKCWLNPDYTLKNPSDEEIESAIKKSRIENLVLHHEDYSIEILEEGTMIDLGAFGKGYAVDAVTEILSDWNIDCTLLSAGRSSIKAIGAPPDSSGWQISISNPFDNQHILKTFLLKDVSVGASGLSKGSHIINTLTGKPEIKKAGSWAFSDNCADADAYSTAFMIWKSDLINEIVSNNEQLSAVIFDGNLNGNIREYGILPDTLDIA